MKLLVLMAFLFLGLAHSAYIRRERPYFYAKPSSYDSKVGILDTFSLSFVGNFDFSKAVEGIRKIFEGVAQFIDLKVIRAIVDFFFENVLGRNSDVNSVYSVDRIETDDTVLREGVTTIVGAVLNKQQCWAKTACAFGAYIKTVPGNDFMMIMVEKMVPSDWTRTMAIVKSAATDQEDCREYLCSPDIEE